MKIEFEALLDQANAKIETLSVQGALAKHDSANVQFVDLRDIRELEREGMIEGAYHCPRGMLEFWVHPGSPYHKPIFADPGKTYVFYCASGWRSALSTATLKDIGMDNVAHIAGGFTAWRDNGGPIAQKKPKS
ncbi:MAG: rhodanese-like domain-containing protein [Pseudomonadota bacterium]